MAAPELVHDPAHEPLSPVEARLVILAKAEADRILNDSLTLIITAHGHPPNDGKRYDFVEEQGCYFLKVTPR